MHNEISENRQFVKSENQMKTQWAYPPICGMRIAAAKAPRERSSTQFFTGGAWVHFSASRAAVANVLRTKSKLSP